MITFEDLFPFQMYMNLEKNTERRKSAEEEFRVMGVNPERMGGVYVQGTGNKIFDGALGCMFAHRTILDQALKRKQNVFIYEDDVMFLGNSPRMIADGACTDLANRKWAARRGDKDTSLRRRFSKRPQRSTQE